MPNRSSTFLFETAEIAGSGSPDPALAPTEGLPNRPELDPVTRGPEGRRGRRPAPSACPARRAAQGLLLALGCLLAAGCFGKGPPRGEVSGTVSLDGQPLPDGTIVFLPHGDTKGPTAGGSIKNGQYHIPRKGGAVVGENRVEIRWGKPTGKRIQDPMNPGGMLEETKEGIPARYNLQSELIRQIKKGSNSGEEFNFDLQSGAK